MIEKLFVLCPQMERTTRLLLSRMPDIKKKVKNRFKQEKIKDKNEFNEQAWKQYEEKVNKLVKDNTIILIHSSMDGMSSIGVDPRQVLDFILSLQEKGCTVVLPAYAISSMKVIDDHLKTYDPLKSPCWTGLLPNYFLKAEGVIRTVFPYNSLAAVGPKAAEMMNDNDQQVYVYGEHSAWKYCVDHHASILFIGTTSNDANTIQAHMIADVMGNEWPIKDWYQTVICPVKINGEIIEKQIQLQKDKWANYVTDYYITDKLKKSGILQTYIVSDCMLEYVEDAKVMTDYLVSLANKGCLSYHVPRKDRKEKENEYRK